MYGVLYAYTPEVFPAPHRGTADALCSAFNRITGVLAPVIKITTTSVSGTSSIGANAWVTCFPVAQQCHRLWQIHQRLCAVGRSSYPPLCSSSQPHWCCSFPSRYGIRALRFGPGILIELTHFADRRKSGNVNTASAFLVVLFHFDLRGKTEIDAETWCVNYTELFDHLKMHL